MSRGCAFGLLWWGLGGDDPLWWWAGLPTVGLAVVVSLALSPGPWRLRWNPGGLARFVPFFLFQSLRGGLDVARRTLHPRLPLNPSLVCYPLRLEESPAQVFMANVVSLLPGTLSADLEGSVLTVHALDIGLPVTEQLQALESRVARLFESTVPIPPGPGEKS